MVGGELESSMDSMLWIEPPPILLWNIHVGVGSNVVQLKLQIFQFSKVNETILQV